MRTLRAALAAATILAGPAAYALDAGDRPSTSRDPSTNFNKLGVGTLTVPDANNLRLGSAPLSSMLLNALPSGRRAVEQGQGDDLTLTLPLAIGATRSNAQRAMDRISVLDLKGVDPTGSTNSRPALLAAITSIKAIKGNAELWFPCGAYLISGGPLLVTGVGTTALVGAGSHCVTIINGNSAAPAIQFGATGQAALDFGNRVEGMLFAAATPGGTLGQVGLQINRQGQFRFRDIKTTRYPAQLYDGIILNRSQQVFADNIETQEAAHDGHSCLDSTDVNVANVRSDANGRMGYTFRGCLGSYFTNITSFGNSQNALFFDTGGFNGHNENLFFTNLVADTSGADNIFARDLKTSMFTNCWGSTQADGTKNTFSAGIHLTTKKVFSNTFNNCTFILNNFAGILSDGEDGTYPYKNSFINPILGAQNVVDGTAPGHGNGRSGTGYGIATGNGGDLTVIGGSAFGNVSGPYSIGTGAKVSIRDVVGINPLPTVGVTVGASPWTYTNGPTEATLCISGGTVTQITTGGAYLSSGGGNLCLPLDANRSITVTYTSAPAVVSMPR